MTIAETKDWNVFIGIVVDEAHSKKVDTTSIERLINKKITLKSYGTSIKEIFGVMITYDSPLHPAYLKYDPTSKVIYIGLKLPKGFVEKSTKSEITTLMQHTFLNGILQMKSLKGITDFDFDGLHQAIKALFFPKQEKR